MNHKLLTRKKMKTAPHILVIDDENYICESCDRIFSKAGYKVDTNISATNGFRQALTNPYDAIILDLNLVESDGMKLLYGIRKRKPYVPVVIITGYPSEDSRRKSTKLGVTDYITKPFEPAELLDPVQKVLTRESVSFQEDPALFKENGETKYHFYLSSWSYQLANGLVRVGGYLPNLSNTSVKSIKLPELESMIYRGLPLAEVTLSDGTIQIIPSSVSGKITVINDYIREHFYNLEKNIYKKSWIALVDPVDLEQDLTANKIRNVLVFAKKSSDENEFFWRIARNGYVTEIANNIKEVLEILSEGTIQVLALDARQFGDKGPAYVRRVSQEFPGVKIIVFNESNVNAERRYRENNIFYYGVNPISNNEMVDLLHCAFTDDNRKITLKNPRVSRFLPNTISKISITNRYGTKVTLLAYNEILQHNEGLGYLLTKELLDMAFPLEIHHSRFHKSIEEVSEVQDIAKEKERNDRIIILQSKELDKIPGSISKEIQEYTNKNASLNLLMNINIQPTYGKASKAEFNAHTTIALKDLIISEMISK